MNCWIFSQNPHTWGKSHHQILAKCHVGLVEERNQEYPCMLSGLTGVPQLEYRAVRNTIVLQAFNEC